MSNAYVTREQMEANTRNLIKRIDDAGVLSSHASSHESGGSDTINHDDLTGFVADEHIDWTGVTGKKMVITNSDNHDAIKLIDSTNNYFMEVGHLNQYAHFNISSGSDGYLWRSNDGTIMTLEDTGALKPASIDATGTIQGSRLISDIAIGTAPLTVTSTTKVTNLNVDQLDGYHSTAFPQLVQTSQQQVNITVDGTWRDLDVTSQTSSDATWVQLYIHTYVTSSGDSVWIQVCEYNDDSVLMQVTCGTDPSYDDAVMWLKLTSSQQFSYRASYTGTGRVGGSTQHIHVVGYIEEK